MEARGDLHPIRRGWLKFFTGEDINTYLSIKESTNFSIRKVITYYRVSTNSQKKEIKNQRTAIESFSINSGIPIDEYLSDIGSGINFKRKNFLKIIDMIEGFKE